MALTSSLYVAEMKEFRYRAETCCWGPSMRIGVVAAISALACTRQGAPQLTMCLH